MDEAKHNEWRFSKIKRSNRWFLANAYKSPNFVDDEKNINLNFDRYQFSLGVFIGES